MNKYHIFAATETICATVWAATWVLSTRTNWSCLVAFVACFVLALVHHSLANRQGGKR